MADTVKTVVTEMVTSNGGTIYQAGANGSVVRFIHLSNNKSTDRQVTIGTATLSTSTDTYNASAFIGNVTVPGYGFITIPLSIALASSVYLYGMVSSANTVVSIVTGVDL